MSSSNLVVKGYWVLTSVRHYSKCFTTCITSFDFHSNYVSSRYCCYLHFIDNRTAAGINKLPQGTHVHGRFGPQTQAVLPLGPMLSYDIILLLIPWSQGTQLPKSFSSFPGTSEQSYITSIKESTMDPVAMAVSIQHSFLVCWLSHDSSFNNIPLLWKFSKTCL